MNILLAIDHSGASDNAVSEVVARPWPSTTKICVLSVVEPPHVMVLPSLVQTATEAAQSLVKNAADRLIGRGFETSTHVIQDHPRTAIAEYAELWGADLIVQVGIALSAPVARRAAWVQSRQNRRLQQRTSKEEDFMIAP